MKILPRIKTRLSTNGENFRKLLKHFYHKKLTSSNSSVKSVFIDLKNPNLERASYILIKYFSLAGYRIDLKMNLWFLLNLRNCAEYIYDIESLNFVTSKPKNCELWITDNENADSGNDRILVVDTNYFKHDKEDYSLTMPYNMHPLIYNEGLVNKLPQLRRRAKNIRIFFTGRTGEGYENPDIEKLFGKLNRNTIVRILKDAFSKNNKITFIDSNENLPQLFSADKFDFVMILKSFIPIGVWFEILAKSSFFIAPPGVSMPFSHNLIEAMSLGSIPITQYPEMMEPPLKDMHNCLAFDNEKELIEKIQLAIDLDSETTEKLRANVINYYDTYLEPRSVISNIINQLPTKKKIYINAEHISVANLKNSIDNKPLS